jgi:hypothetical protein
MLIRRRRVQMKKQKKPYVKPEVTRVKLEDKRVVTMGNCKTGPSDCSTELVPNLDYNQS